MTPSLLLSLLLFDISFLTGFSANKCTAIFMEYTSGDILHFEVGDSREVNRNSSKLERLTISRGIAHLRERGIRISEIISDASKSLIALLSMYDNHVSNNIQTYI